MENGELVVAEDDILDNLSLKPPSIPPPPIPSPSTMPLSSLKLDRVLGLTISGNNCSFSSHPESSTVAYPAGCVAVLLDVKKNRQTHLGVGLGNVQPQVTSKKACPITCLSFSPDGRHLITGECGHQPSVRVWDVRTGSQLVEFENGHKYGVTCVAFSPSSPNYCVSIGSHHDMVVNVWDWKSGVKVAGNKVSARVKALSFAEDGSYFVTVGVRHVKFWYLDFSSASSSSNNNTTSNSTNAKSSTFSSNPEAVPLMGRSAILSDQRNNTFCDVGCGRGSMSSSTFAISESGLLCEFNSRRLLDKWVELRTSRAHCLRVGQSMIVIGCADGIIRVFNPTNLHFICTLPRPHAFGTDVSKGLSGMIIDNHNNESAAPKYADCVAVTLMEESNKVVSVYSDHSMYVWDVKDTKRVGKSHSWLYHSSCIWGIELYRNGTLLPPGTFFTCSSDDTIRVWNLDSQQSLEGYVFQRNIYSQELLKIVYMDPEMKYLSDHEMTALTAVNGKAAGANGDGGGENGQSPYDGKNGVRCLRVSPDGRHLASGDRSGNIIIRDLSSQVDIVKIEAHDSEVLCLEYTDPNVTNGRYLFASASRDRLIHLFDVSSRYSFLTTLDDHNSAITAVKFVVPSNTSNEATNSLLLLSCGADKSVIFRKSSDDGNVSDSGGRRGSKSFTLEHNIQAKTTLYDMEVLENTSVLTACQDRQIRFYGVESGKMLNCLKGSLSKEGTLIKLSLDPSAQFVATSSTDKSLTILDVQSGEIVATSSGHSEPITGLKFSSNGRSLISVSGDGCIFVWKLPAEIANVISGKLGLPPVPPEKPAFISSVLRSGVMSPEKRMSLSSTNKWTNRKSCPPDSFILRPPSITSPNASDHEDSLKTNSVNSIKSDEEGSSTVHSSSGTASDHIVYYPQDDDEDDSLHKTSFEVRIEKGIVNNGSISGSITTSSPSQRSLSNSNLQNSLSVPNFNDLHSDDECDVSMSISGISGDGRMSRGLNHLSPYKPRNPLYLSTEQLNESSQPSMVRTTAHFLLESSRSSLSTQHLKSSNPPPPTETAASGRDLHHQQEQLSGENDDFYHNNLSRSMSSLAMTSSSTRSKQRREELTKAVSEARKKLQSLGWKSSGNNSLSSSKSVTDLRFRSSHPPSTNSATSGFYTSSSHSSSSVPRSISMSDLSFGPSRRLLERQQQLQNQREGIDIPVSAPVWDNHKSTENLSAVGLKKSTSITSLAKREKRAGKTQGWGLPTPLSLGGMRSGRASAPPARPGGRQLRLPNGGSIPGTQSSDDESTTDEESSSSYVRTNLLRPGTPPKPSLLRQVRRSSTSHVFSPNSPFGGTLSSKSGGLMANNNNIPHQGTLARSRSRKLWDNNFELRSSKSEYNLNFMGRDSGISRSGSRVNLSSSFWENNRIDFQSSNPATIELTRESCEQVIEELNFMAIFVRKMFKRTQSNPATQGLAEFLADGVVKTINTLSAVVPLPMASTSSPRLLQPHLHHHLLQQQQQQLLMSQKSPIHHNMRHHQQQQNVLSPSSNSSSGGPGNPPVPMNLLVQYSDALLSLMQQRMQQQQQNQHLNNNQSSSEGGKSPTTDL